LGISVEEWLEFHYVHGKAI